MSQTYVAPTVHTSQSKEIVNDNVTLFTVAVVTLLALAVTISAGAAIYCMSKGGDFEFVVRLTEAYVRVACDLS
ncbi:MAG: hypothetical protein ACOC1K_03290 [Nanoarchaeota archaeon]